MKKNIPIILACLLLLTFACTKVEQKPDPAKIAAQELANKNQMEALMKKHLDAVTNRDLKTLEGTLDPEGNMQLILPGTEIMKSNKAFMNYHREWFKDTSDWTFETKILNTVVGEKVGMAVTEVVYREPERDGKPYFNRMVVSYDLKKEGEKWYLIKDHASSIQKSTDDR